MKRNTFTVLAASAVAICCLGCHTTSSTPAAPAPASAASTSPSFTAPTPQSPTNGQLLNGLTPTLTASGATVDIASYVPQYRFQVVNATGTLVQDSGLMSSPTWPMTVALTPNSKYTWKARAESQGFAGPWSDPASFTTPDPPPAFAGQIGDWEHCAGLTSTTLVECVWNAVRPVNSVGAFEVTKRVAWLLRGSGGGLLIKDGGENTILWQGYSFSASRMCFADGHIFKLIGDTGPGGANSPQFADNDFVELRLYVPAINPIKP